MNETFPERHNTTLLPLSLVRPIMYITCQHLTLKYLHDEIPPGFFVFVQVFTNLTLRCLHSPDLTEINLICMDGVQQQSDFL